MAWLRRPAPRIPARPYHFPTKELAELDRAIQARFAIVPDKDFGLGRVGPRHSYFSPVIQEERMAVRNLQSAQQEIIFYVVGRNIILKEINWLGYTPVQGPVYITPQTPFQVAPEMMESWKQTRFLSTSGVAKDAPSDQELVKLSRQVFKNDALRNGVNRKIGKWSVVARPIAASSQQCVDCHNSRPPQKVNQSTWNGRPIVDTISLNDIIGIALYCYRKAGKIETKKLSEDEVLAKRYQ